MFANVDTVYLPHMIKAANLMVKKNVLLVSLGFTSTVRVFVSEQMSRLSAPIFDKFFKNGFFRA